MSSSGTILVTGATGRTGQRTVELLLERGHRVRSLAHTADARSRKPAEAGADVVAGGPRDLKASTPSWRTSSPACFVHPVEMDHGQVAALCPECWAGKLTGSCPRRATSRADSGLRVSMRARTDASRNRTQRNPCIHRPTE
ncbi:NAD(P)H-binding protein [Streptomyces sp. NPDC059224]|uniref:NmrA family NAD(P)-binding protein n=1 Tax=Streptomyces sp. NPDC059224 TaxID=3346775 RepID=UPI0036C16653